MLNNPIITPKPDRKRLTSNLGSLEVPNLNSANSGSKMESSEDIGK